MRFLNGDEEAEGMIFIGAAIEAARNATCERSKCGSVIISGNEIIGYGFNTPPLGLESQRRCSNDKSKYHPKVTDKTCCMHAEENAIMDALTRNPGKVKGSRLYFVRLGKEDVPTRAGKPYCTICSKLALSSGIREFVLWHDQGICVYDTEEYNALSYQYDEI